MSVDYTPEVQIERVRDVLILALGGAPLQLTSGNCILMDESRELTDLGRLYVELWDDGGRNTGDGDSTLIEKWMLGVTIYAALVTDQVARNIAASRELREASHLVRNALHMHYDADFWPEPIRYRSRSKIRTVRSGLRCQDLRFEIMSIEEYSAIIGTAAAAAVT